MTFPHAFPIFIFGPARGGTSIVSNTLRLHPLVRISLRESRFIDRIPIWTKRGLPGPIVFESIKHQLTRALSRCTEFDRPITESDDFRKLNQLTEEFVKSRDEPLAWRLYAQLLHRIGEVTNANADNQRLLDKSNSWWTIATVAKIFPNAQLLIVLRDPRDLALTHAKLAHHESRLDTIVKNALYWRRFARLGKKFHQSEPQRAHIVGYEDFVCKQPATLLGLCENLHLRGTSTSMVVDMLDRAHGHLSFDPQMQNQGLSSVAVERWREQMIDQEVAIVEAICGVDLFNYFGYRVESTSSDRSRALSCLARSYRLATRALIDRISSDKVFTKILRHRIPINWHEDTSN